ncbi:MAG TPA: M15 family metallopeptidase [Rhizomicrobium sp.]|jgi:D-alanyl-D-alanine dipeptidase|nr:M15 family metallopeptidase [Rhizomicrobium sp.]
MSPPLEYLRNRPIPDQANARVARAGFRTKVPLDTAHVLYGESLVDVRAYGIAGDNFYHSEKNPPYWRRIDGSIPDLLARRTVVEKLAAVNDRLKPAGLELYLFDAWRPRAVQAYFHDVWTPAELQRRNPSLTGAALLAEVETYWAAPTDDPMLPAPHSTGAACDLTLRFIGSDQLWMGSIFDDATPLAHRDRFETSGADLAFSDEEARANRRLLHWVMTADSFTGHPDEWWHFSWGDQLWAALSGAGAAHYGLAQPS